MTAQTALRVAEIVLTVHIGVIVFIVFGLIAIPIGGRLGLEFVRALWWRGMHLSLMGVVAVQKLLGRACFLTVWEGRLMQRANPIARVPAVHLWAERLIYLDLPLWVFTVAYAVLFAYVLALWFAVPPRRAPIAGSAISKART